MVVLVRTALVIATLLALRGAAQDRGTSRLSQRSQVPRIFSILYAADADSDAVLKQLEEAIASGADMHARGPKRNENALSAALFKPHLVSRLLALGVSTEEADKQGVTPLDLVFNWTGLVPPTKGTEDYTSIQADVGLARDLSHHGMGAMVTAGKFFHASIVGRLAGWDSISRTEVRQLIARSKSAAGLVWRPDHNEPLAPAETWICVRVDMTGVFSTALERDTYLKGYLVRGWKVPADGVGNHLKYVPVSLEKDEKSVTVQSIRRSLRNPLLQLPFTALTKLEQHPHPYRDKAGRRLLGYDVRALFRFPGHKPERYLTQVLADGTTTPWYSGEQHPSLQPRNLPSG